MAYISAEDVKAIRTALKAEFPAFKFSCTRDHKIGINVAIKSGPVDFAANFNATNAGRGDFRPANSDNMGINHFWCHEHFSGAAKDMLVKVVEIIKTASARQWFDKSDLMTDYFHTAFHIHLEVGRWNAPYVLKG